MTENFEDITAELTADEKKRVFDVLSVLRKHRKGSEIKSGAIISLCWFRFGFDISSATLRKIVSYARRNGLEAICSSSKGYYVAVDREEIASQVRSLRQRAAAISAAADGLEKAAPPISTQKTLKEYVADVWPTKADQSQTIEVVRNVEAERENLAEKITATIERLTENIAEGVEHFGLVVTADAAKIESTLTAASAAGAARRSDLTALRGDGSGGRSLGVVTINEAAQVLGALARQEGVGLDADGVERYSHETWSPEPPARFLPTDPDELAAVIAQDIKRAEARNE